MKEKINWQKELIESGRFNDKFSKNLLDHGAKNFNIGLKRILLGAFFEFHFFFAFCVQQKKKRARLAKKY